MAFFKVEKDPDAIRTYTLDWADGGLNDGLVGDTGWLQGDTIATSTWIPESTLNAVVDSKSDTTTSVKVSGGTLGKRHLLTNRITTTTGGETEDRTIEVKIVPK